MVLLTLHRVRGYQYKTESKGEQKRNPRPYRSLDDGNGKLAEALLPGSAADAGELQELGFATKIV